MTSDPPGGAAQAQIWAIIGGPSRYAALLAFTRLGCPDRLGAEPMSTEVLASSCDADPAALGRLLRCCACLGIIAPVSGGRWELAPAGHALVSGGPMRAAVLSAGRQPGWLSLLALDDAVRSGRPVFRDHGGGAGAREWHAPHPDDGRTFQRYMTDRSAPAGHAAAGLDYAGARTVADIGGGYGTILAAVLDAHPHLSGILLDRPDVLPGAEAYLAARGLNGRCALLAGDYLDPDAIPPADVYILGSILHNHDDGQARRILGNLLSASPAARILLAEILLPANPCEPDIGTDMDMRRLAIGGRERTSAEWDALLASAGLDITATAPTASPLAIIDTRPAAGGPGQAPGGRASAVAK